MINSKLDVEILRKFVLGKCDSFTNMGLWPTGQKLKPYKWLDNFRESEIEHALYLLNSFTFYNLDLSIALLKGAILKLSESLTNEGSISNLYQNWREFLHESIFLPATGELRNITDSGTFLAGLLRRDLLISEDKIFTIDQLYDSAYIGILTSKKRIIFFDDFVGSGLQFNTMWNEPFERDSNFLSSLKEKCEALSLVPYFCGMVATQKGLENIHLSSPEVHTFFSHTLQETDSPLSPNSSVWPDHLKSSSNEFIRTTSLRAGIPEKDIFGFHNLGLAIAFTFTIPDATLPIFRWNQNSWSPLMIKS